MTMGYKDDVTVLNKFATNGVFIFNFKKHTFVNRVFTLILVYRKQYEGVQGILS